MSKLPAAPCKLRPQRLLWLLVFALPNTADADDPARFFESKIRPLLAKHCFECHGPEKQESGLRLDSRQALLTGGDSGPILTLDPPDGSLMLEVLSHQGDIKMPPDGPLEPGQIEAVAHWIQIGLPWPTTTAPSDQPTAIDPADHWAFQPIQHPPAPELKDDTWSRGDLDRFILDRLHESNLRPSPQADPSTLVRRASFALTGLPPTPESVVNFSNAYQKDPGGSWSQLIDQLLDSPHYGEHQARHWLDVARYADNKGYVFFEEKNFPWAWTYRDWVIDAMNRDLPYDQFILDQLAADVVKDRQPASLAAMGFLTLGPRFMNNTHDVIDDRIDVVTRGLLGLTVTCARCHNHKFDPIPQQDYYSLYGVFRSSRQPLVGPLFAEQPNTEAYRQFQAGLQERLEKLHKFLDQQRTAIRDGARGRITEYLVAAYEKRKHPSTENFMLLTDKGAIIPAILKRWETYLKRQRRDENPVWTVWLAFNDVPEEEIGSASKQVLGQLDSSNTNPLVLKAFDGKEVKAIGDVAKVYGELFQSIDAQWQQLLEKDTSASEFSDPASEQLRQAIYGVGAPAMIPRELTWGFLELLPDRPTQGEYKKLLKEVETYSQSAAGAPPRAMVLQDAEVLYDPVVFLRGNPHREGDSVKRQFLTALSPVDRKAFVHGSGRLDLAQQIIDPSNPLTARVMVNRIWQQHFGVGIVQTASDFGLQGSRPSHPRLLDWLATELIHSGWSIKHIHRLVMNSATFQQSSHGSPTDADPENQLLWKFPRRRLSFESIRDAQLMVSGDMDPTVGGKPVNVLSGYNPRRSIYGFIDRMDLPGLMRTFDFPEPASTSPRRDATIVPQQALYFLNHDFVYQTARRIVAREEIADCKDRNLKLERIHMLLFGRAITEEEQQIASEFIAHDTPKIRPLQWKYGYGGIDEKIGRTATFEELHHWTGTRIQAGAKLPDPKLGWVFHDAAGGHPASSMDRCFILRWISPVTSEIEIDGLLKHVPEPGNGVRGQIVSSVTGILGQWKVDQSEAQTTVKTTVKEGTTIDFVVDWQDHITHDEFQWPVVIKTLGQAVPARWSSQEDFRKRPPDRWADYVHGLLMTNEFIYVD